MKALPAATLMSLILFLERRDADIPDAFGLFKNGRRQSVSCTFVADIPTGIKNNSVKKKEDVWIGISLLKEGNLNNSRLKYIQCY